VRSHCSFDGEHLSQRLDIVLDALARAVDVKIQKFVRGLTPPDYSGVGRHFFAKFGRDNPDDAGRLIVLKNLRRTHVAAEIIAAIDAILETNDYLQCQN
jgi:hypothetical protein